MDLKDLPQVIAAIGGLGTAAFGLVDTCKAISFDGFGVNHIGFGLIRDRVSSLTPAPAANALSQAQIVNTLRANWVNGTDLSAQKAIAKSLIKLNLNSGNAGALAGVTGVDPTVLGAVASSIQSGTPLTAAQNEVYARFDFIVTAQLDESYQRADNLYRNWTRTLASVIAVGLAVFGGYVMDASNPQVPRSVIVGLLATPLAPIAKDVSSALATAVNSMQAVRKA